MSAPKQEGLSPLFQYQHAKGIIDIYMMRSGSTDLQQAWALALEIVEAQTRFYKRFWDEPVARAKAWEDFDIAFRGRGSPGISGAVFEIWQHIPKRGDSEFIGTLIKAFAAAHAHTDPRYLRYMPHDRSAPFRTLEDGFDEPEAEARDVPIPSVAQGIPPAQEVRDFALKHGKQVMTFDPKPEVSNAEEKPRSPFTVLRGGRDNPDGT